jgi:hypothetical protein
LDQQKSRLDHPQRFDIKPTLAERCLRKPLQRDSNAQDWYIKSFESRSRSATSTAKSNSIKQQSRQVSADVLKKSSMSQHHSGM